MPWPRMPLCFGFGFFFLDAPLVLPLLFGKIFGGVCELFD